jgi:hypothetical protein
MPNFKPNAMLSFEPDAKRNSGIAMRAYMSRSWQRGDALRALPVGRIVLLAPAKMKVGDARQVEANVGLDVPEDVLKRNLRSGDQKLESIARVSTEMAATLTGAGFKITPVSPEQQTLAVGFATVWTWTVEAKEQGEQFLEATLYALVPEGTNTPRQRVDSYTQKISVDVRERTWGEWFEAFGRQFDEAKSIVIALFGLGTVITGWLGISFAFRAKKKARAPLKGKRAAPLRSREGEPE